MLVADLRGASNEELLKLFADALLEWIGPDSILITGIIQESDVGREILRRMKEGHGRGE